MLTLLRIAAKMALIMFGLPALGLLAFHGGYGAAFIATILITVVGVGVTIVLIPAMVGAELLAAVTGGILGVRIMSFVIETVLYAISLAGVAWLMSSVALVGFWPTIGAAAIIAVVSNILTAHKTN